LAEEVAAAAMNFFPILQSRLNDRIGDLAFCRQRLRHLYEILENPEVGDDSTPLPADRTVIHSPLPSAESYFDTIRQSQTARLVLPDGQDDLELAARKFVRGLTAEQLAQLDQALQDRVLAPLGGLHHTCMTGCDVGRQLGGPLLTGAADFLGELLPVTDVAQVELSSSDSGEAVAARIQQYFAAAVPLVGSKEGRNQSSFLLVPASDFGKALGEAARAARQDLELVKVAGQAELMFCREQGFLTLDDLQHLLRPCRKSYDESAPAPTSSPHARFDILDWVPLDP